MTSYFDGFHARLRAASSITDWQQRENELRTIDETIVYDAYLCAARLRELHGSNPVAMAARLAIHEVVMKRSVYCRPPGSIALDFGDEPALIHGLHDLTWDMHTVFHEIARLRLDGFSDQPTMPMRCMFGDEESFAVEHFRTFTRYNHLAGADGKTLCNRPLGADIKIVEAFADYSGDSCPTCAIEDDNRRLNANALEDRRE